MYTENGILSHKMEWCTDNACYKEWAWKHYDKRKMLDIKGNILYDSIYMKYPEQTNLQPQKAY